MDQIEPNDKRVARRIMNLHPFQLMLLSWFCKLITIAVFMSLGNAVGLADDLDNTIRDQFGVAFGEIVELEFSNHSRQQTIEIEIARVNYQLELRPYSVRSRNEFRVRLQLQNGTMVQWHAPKSHLFKGVLVGIEGSRAVGSISEHGLSAKIVMDADETLFVEPLAGRMEGDGYENQHLVYRTIDVERRLARCGLLGKIENDVVARTAIVHGPPALNSKALPVERARKVNKVARLACDADVEYFQTYGTVQATVDRIELIVAIVNDQYDRDVDIVHEITEIIVRTAEPDPYTTTHWLDLRSELFEEWQSNQQNVPHDLGHLFTGKDLTPGNIVGLAGGVGVVCTDEAYALAQSDYNGNLSCATDLTAHELGHMWNASHCPGNCVDFTMFGSIQCANRFHPEYTIPTITAFRESLDCLVDEILLGDINCDGSVNLLDISPFVDLLTAGGFSQKADINLDGTVDLLDIAPFVELIAR